MPLVETPKHGRRTPQAWFVFNRPIRLMGMDRLPGSMEHEGEAMMRVWEPVPQLSVKGWSSHDPCRAAR